MRLFRLALIVGATAFAAARPVAAQVIVPPRGEGTVDVLVQNYRHTGHFDKDGHKDSNTSTDSQILIGQLDFGVTDSWGLAVSLPIVASKYTGPPTYIVKPNFETNAGPLDNGKYHAAAQDLRIEVRRMFVAGPVVLAPLVGVSLPTHNYETRGESVPGRHRKELLVGVGGSTEIVPRTEIHGRYAYSTLERLNGFPYTKSIIDASGDVTITSRFSAQGLLGLQIGHKRPTLGQLEPIWDTHDRYINANQLNIGGGGSWAITRTTDVYVFALRTVWGRYGAHISRTFGFGISKSFGDSFGGFGG